MAFRLPFRHRASDEKASCLAEDAPERVTLLRLLIVLFFLWHVFALTIEGIPLGAGDPVSRLLRGTYRPVFHPYMLVISQWQRWNLFAPDPDRYTVEWTIDAWKGSAWQTVLVLRPSSFTGWYRSKLFTAIRALDQDYGMLPLRARFIETFCETSSLYSGTPLLLRRHVASVVDPTSTMDVTDARTFCP